MLTLRTLRRLLNVERIFHIYPIIFVIKRHSTGKLNICEKYFYMFIFYLTVLHMIFYNLFDKSLTDEFCENINSDF